MEPARNIVLVRVVDVCQAVGASAAAVGSVAERTAAPGYSHMNSVLCTGETVPSEHDEQISSDEPKGPAASPGTVPQHACCGKG